MTPDALLASARGTGAPPPGLSPALLALWWDARGDWAAAHAAAQDDRSAAGSWVHAYLHRKEGDLGNAAYWYARAGQPVARGALDDEWLGIATGISGPRNFQSSPEQIKGSSPKPTNTGT